MFLWKCARYVQWQKYGGWKDLTVSMKWCSRTVYCRLSHTCLHNCKLEHSVYLGLHFEVSIETNQRWAKIPKKLELCRFWQNPDFIRVQSAVNFQFNEAFIDLDSYTASYVFVWRTDFTLSFVGKYNLFSNRRLEKSPDFATDRPLNDYWSECFSLLGGQFPNLGTFQWLDK